MINNIILDKWIPVNEKLPEKGKDVLVSTKNSVYIAYFKDNKFWDEDDRAFSKDSILAWLPLPKPYKKSDK